MSRKVLTVALTLFLSLMLGQTRSEDDPGADKDPAVLAKIFEAARIREDNYQGFLSQVETAIIFYYLPTFEPLALFEATFHRASHAVRTHLPSHSFNFGYVNTDKDRSLAGDQLLVDEGPFAFIFINQIPMVYRNPNETPTYAGLPAYVEHLLEYKCPVAKEIRDIRFRWNYSFFYLNRNKPLLNKVMDVLGLRYSGKINIYRVEHPQDITAIARVFGTELSVGNFVILARREHDQQTFVYEGHLNSVDIQRFLETTYQPRVAVLNERTFDWAADEKIAFLTLFYQSADLVKDKIKDKVQVLQRMADELLANKIVLVLADMNQDFVYDFADKHGIPTSSPYSLFLMKPYKPNVPKYQFLGKTITEPAVSEFIAEFKSGTLKRYLKSEPSTLATLGGLGILVGSDFTKNVLEPKDYHAVVFFFDRLTENMIEDFRSSVHDTPVIPGVRYFVYNFERNDNPAVDSKFHRKIVLFPRFESPPIEVPVDSPLIAETLIEFLKAHLRR